MTEEKELEPLSAKHQLVLDNYFLCWNRAEAYQRVYPNTTRQGARASACKLFKDENFAAHLKVRMAEVHMSADEALKRLADIARGDMGEFLNVEPDGSVSLRLSAQQKTALIKRIKNKKTIYKGKNADREIYTEEIELYSALDALEKVLRVHEKIPTTDLSIKVTINGADND